MEAGVIAKSAGECGGAANNLVAAGPILALLVLAPVPDFFFSLGA